MITTLSPSDMEQHTLHYLEICEKLNVQPQLIIIEYLTCQTQTQTQTQTLTLNNPSALQLSHLQDGDVEALCAVLPLLADTDHRLLELELLNGEFGVRGTAAISSWLENEQFLQSLSLVGSPICDTGALALAEALIRSNNCNLTALNVSNTNINVRGLEVSTPIFFISITQHTRSQFAIRSSQFAVSQFAQLTNPIQFHSCIT